MKAALKLVTDNHLSIVPVRTDGTKRPLLKWEKFIEAQADTKEIERWYTKWPGLAIAVVAGKVSGNLEIIDIDSGDLLTDFFEQVQAFNGEAVLEKLVIIQTPRPGYHIYYRCPEMVTPGNQKLAMKPNPTDPAHPLTLIETRGEGGYAVTPFSPLNTHETGKPYEFIQGDFDKIKEITPDERRILIEAAMSLTQVIPVEKVVRDPTPQNKGQIGTRPGDEYNAKATWDEILDPLGWTVERVDGDVRYWRQPQKQNKGWSASTNYGGNDLLYVFSSNCHPFDGGTGYTKFTALAISAYGGKFADAARALAGRGFGVAPKLEKQREAQNADPGDTTVPGAESLGFDHLFGTDFAAGKRCTSDWKHVLKFCPEWDFVHYRDGVWHPKSGLQAKALGKITAQRFDEQIAQLPIELRVDAIKASKGMHSAKGIKNMLEMAASEEDLKIKIGDFDTPATSALLNCPNCVIDLNTGDPMPHDPKYLMTGQIPVEYDRYAQAPRFIRFLNEVMEGDQEMIAFIIRWMGYCLSGFTNEEKMIFLHGQGSNGKTVLRNVMLWLCGPLAATMPKCSFLYNQPDQTQNMTRAANARVAVTSEISENDRLDEGRLKDFVTGEKQSGKILFKDGHDITPRAKLWMHGNHLPRITGTDDGIWRRIMLVPFNVKFEENQKDIFLVDKLKAELPGILALAVKGYQDWSLDGLRPPAKCLQATQVYREESNSIGICIAEICDKSPYGIIKARALYNQYQVWCEKTGRSPVSETKFGRELDRLGYEKKPSSTATLYLGISFKQTTNNEEK